MHRGGTSSTGHDAAHRGMMLTVVTVVWRCRPTTEALTISTECRCPSSDWYRTLQSRHSGVEGPPLAASPAAHTEQNGDADTQCLNERAPEYRYYYFFIPSVVKIPRVKNKSYYYYAALLPRRGPHIASHSVRLSVRPSRYRYRASRRAT